MSCLSFLIYCIGRNLPDRLFVKYHILFFLLKSLNIFRLWLIIWREQQTLCLKAYVCLRSVTKIEPHQSVKRSSLSREAEAEETIEHPTSVMSVFKFREHPKSFPFPISASGYTENLLLKCKTMFQFVLKYCNFLESIHEFNTCWKEQNESIRNVALCRYFITCLITFNFLFPTCMTICGKFILGHALCKWLINDFRL